jgi:hypothetical protein
MAEHARTGVVTRSVGLRFTTVHLVMLKNDGERYSFTCRTSSISR